MVFISRISVSVTELFVDSIIMQVSLHLKKLESIAIKQSPFYRGKIHWLHTSKAHLVLNQHQRSAAYLLMRLRKLVSEADASLVLVLNASRWRIP